MFSIAFSRFGCTVLMITRWKVDYRNVVRNTSMTKKRGLTKVSRARRSRNKTEWSHILFPGVKFLVLNCRSFQVSKKSAWEFVEELSNTRCVLNCEKQGHEKKYKVFRKDAKKGRWRSLYARAFSPLSYAYLARYPS